jgi:prevent-host-death family protein
MLTVSAAEFQRNFGRYQDEAVKQPVSITGNGRDRLIVVSVDEYQRLKQQDRAAFKTHDLSEADISPITEGVMDPRHNHLNAALA